MNKKQFNFIAIDGPHESTINEDGWVYLKMSDVNAVEKNIDSNTPFFVLNTGSPHYIEMVDSINSVDVFGLGQMIRYNDRFKSEGINVNFVEQQDDKIFVRTYERGVENETLACGTGVTASAIGAYINSPEKFNNYQIQTLGGALKVSFKEKDKVFTEVFLEGPAEYVYKGSIEI